MIFYVQKEISRGIELPTDYNIREFSALDKSCDIRYYLQEQERFLVENEEICNVFCSINVARIIENSLLYPKKYCNNLTTLKNGIIFPYDMNYMGQQSILDWNVGSTILPRNATLNPDGALYRVGDLLSFELYTLEQEKEYFVRPNSGWKPFTGFIGTPKDIEFELKFFLERKDVSKYDIVVIAPKQNIEDIEYRFWVDEYGISTKSAYSWNRERADENIEVPKDALNFAEEVAGFLDNYTSYTLVVFDIAKTETEYKLIEFNSFSTSGWYKGMDVDRLFKSLI
jgi:hypothetical protein